jgi:hypothetical protein
VRTTELQRVNEALQPRRMGPRIATSVGGSDRRCSVLDAKYEPGLRGIVLYEHDGRLVRGDLLIEPADDAATDPRVVEPGVRVSVFPEDADLPSLPSVMDPTRLGRALTGTIDATAPRVTLLRYRPSKRATVRIDSSRASAPLIGKVYHDPAKAGAVAGEWRPTAAAGATLRLAPIVAHVPELALVIQQAMPGTSLGELLAHGQRLGTPAIEGVRRAAHALAELHDGPLSSARARPVAKELRRFEQRARRIASVDSGKGELLLGLAQRLLDLEPDLQAGPTGVVHGDCKPGQFLLAPDGRVVLLDLDHLGTSEQAGDVGTFVASLRQLAARQGRAPFTELENAFIAAYAGRRPAPGLRSRIRWHTAVALERKALRAFARAPRSPFPAALAREGHRCLDEVTA